MDCAKAEGLLQAYLDRELEEAEKADLMEHLGACAKCAAAGREFRQLNMDGRKYFRASLPGADQRAGSVRPSLQQPGGQGDGGTDFRAESRPGEPQRRVAGLASRHQQHY